MCTSVGIKSCNKQAHKRFMKCFLIWCVVELLIDKFIFVLQMEKQGKLQLQTRLCSLSLSDQAVVNLYHFIETEGTFGKISSMLRCITKTRGQAAMLAKKALKDLEEIVHHLSTSGSKLEVCKIKCEMIFLSRQFHSIMWGMGGAEAF